MSWWWSWLLSAVGLIGLWLAGSHRAVGWQIGIAVQVLWITYAVVTGQWGFIVASVGYATVNVRNLLRWRRAERFPHHPDEPREGTHP